MRSGKEVRECGGWVRGLRRGDHLRPVALERAVEEHGLVEEAPRVAALRPAGHHSEPWVPATRGLSVAQRPIVVWAVVSGIWPRGG